MDFFCHETNKTENGNGTSKGGLSFVNKNTSKQLSYQLSTSYLKISFAVKWKLNNLHCSTMGGGLKIWLEQTHFSGIRRENYFNFWKIE